MSTGETLPEQILGVALKELTENKTTGDVEPGVLLFWPSLGISLDSVNN